MYAGIVSTDLARSFWSAISRYSARFMQPIIHGALLPVKHGACRPSESKSLDFAAMKPVSQIRRERLAQLILEVGTQVAIGDAIGKNKNQIYQWLLPDGEKGARNMSDASARRIETAFNKPTGWLDTLPEGFSGVAESTPAYGVTQSYLGRLNPATIRTVHEMLRWRFDYEGQRYDLEAMPELFSLAFQAAVSGSDADKAALKVAVDQALLQGKDDDTTRRDDEPAPGARPIAAKRGGSRS